MEEEEMPNDPKELEMGAVGAAGATEPEGKEKTFGALVVGTWGAEEEGAGLSEPVPRNEKPPIALERSEGGAAAAEGNPKPKAPLGGEGREGGAGAAVALACRLIAACICCIEGIGG